MWACNVLQDFPHADLDGDSEVMILSSQSYCRDLTPTLETLYTVHTPLKGLGIGQQLQYLTRELARSPGAQKAGK